MLKVMMLGPFDGKGRHRGGIHTVVNGLQENQQLLEANGLRLIPFNTCRIQRKNQGVGKLNLSNLRNAWHLFRDVEQVLRREKPEVFYLHSSVGFALLRDLLLLRRVKDRHGCKTVLHIHVGQLEKLFTGTGLWDRWIWKLICGDVDEVVLLSERTLEQLVQRGLPREKCHLLYNFASLSVKEEQLTTGNGRNFLFLGAVTVEKGIFDLLAAVEQLEEPVRLQVCGEFEDEATRQRFMEQAKALGEKVEYRGFVTGDEKQRILQEAAVLVLPSYGEGLPMAILEALEAGCGLVLTAVGAIPEIIGPENGIVIHPGDRAALQKALECYLSMEPEQLQQQQLRNHQKARDFSLQQFVEKMAAICTGELPKN